VNGESMDWVPENEVVGPSGGKYGLRDVFNSGVVVV